MIRKLTFAICWVWLLASGPALALPVPLPTFEFIANRGQWPAPVQFGVPLAAGRLFVEPTALTYALVPPRPHQDAAADSGVFRPRHGHAYRVHFEGASAQATVIGENPTGQYRSYLRGADAARWASQVPVYAAVRYEQLYPSIQLRLYENPQQQLEYTFTVQPGGQPTSIALRYEGSNGLRLDAEGNLHITTGLGEVTELAPHAWQLAATGLPEPIACAFELDKNTVRFRLGSYDAARPLIIDPAIVFATFSGATAENWGHTTTYDAQGNLYSAGTVFEPGYPASLGAFDPSFNGSVDVAIIKYNSAATGAAARVYATYLGGREADVPHRLVTNAQGELLILGTTSSADFPVTAGAYDPSFSGGAIPQIGTDGIEYRQGIDLFVARLSADGSRLLAATFLGSSGIDGFAVELTPVIGGPLVVGPYTSLRFLGDIQVDAADNVCIASTTNSRDFPTAAGYATTYRGGRSDAVVCQFSPDLRQLRWSTFLGGDDADAAYALAPDRQGGWYVVGGTLSTDFPFSAGAYQSAAGGQTDAFVAHLSANGRVLLAASRLGTAMQDVARLVQLDAAGNVLVLGQSNGLMPVTPGCYGAPGRNFLQRLSPNLSQLQFAATLGSPSVTYSLPADIALGVDECDHIYVAALAYAEQVTDLPLSPTPTGGRFFVAWRFSADARTLEYVTALPGEHVHGVSRFDAHGNLYLAVCGNCDAAHSFFVSGVNTFAAHTATGKCNNASLKVNLQAAVPGNTPPQTVCINASPVQLGGSPAGGAWAGPGVEPATGGGYQFVPSPALLGTQVLVYTPAGSTCPVASQLVVVTTPTPIVLAPAGPFCYGTDSPQNVGLSAQPAGGFFSGPGVVYNGARTWYFAPNLAGPGTHTITYTLNQNGQCGTASQTIVVKGARLRIFPTDTAFCGEIPRPFQFRAVPAGGTWSGTSITPTGYWTPNAANPASSSYGMYTYTSPDGCITRQNYSVRIYPDATPSTVVTPPACPYSPGNNALAPFTFTFPDQVVYASYYWEYGDGTFSSGYTGAMPAQTHTYQYPGSYTATLHVQHGLGCTRTVQYAFTIGEGLPLPNIITPNGDGLNDAFVQREFCVEPALRIFSRWGQEVYHTEQYQNDWRAPGLPAGIYYYRLVGERGRSAKGWLEVVK